MKDAPKILFLLTLALAIIWSGVHFVSFKGLPPSWVHALERGLESLHTSSSELIKPRSDLSGLIGSQRKQEEMIADLSKQLDDLQEHAVQSADEVIVARKDKDNALVIQMMQTQAASQQEEVKRYKDLVDELNKEKREEANKKSKPMPIIITSLLGLAALFVLLSKKYDAEATKWAVGTLGIVAGFWLGGA
jgi:hypothetical protein